MELHRNLTASQPKEKRSGKVYWENKYWIYARFHCDNCRFRVKGTVVLHRDGLGAKPWQRECQGGQFPYRIHWKGDYKIKTKTDKLRE
jgi:hypothetical protein